MTATARIRVPASTAATTAHARRVSYSSVVLIATRIPDDHAQHHPRQASNHQPPHERGRYRSKLGLRCEWRRAAWALRGALPRTPADPHEPRRRVKVVKARHPEETRVKSIMTVRRAHQEPEHPKQETSEEHPHRNAERATRAAVVQDGGPIIGERHPRYESQAHEQCTNDSERSSQSGQVVRIHQHKSSPRNTRLHGVLSAGARRIPA